MVYIVIALLGIIIFSVLNSKFDQEEKNREKGTPDNNSELTIKTTQIIYPQSGEIEDQSFTFKAYYKGTKDLARIYDNGYVDLYKRMENIESRFGENKYGKKVRTDSFIRNGERYDITFIQNSDIKIYILTVKYDLITLYR